MEDETLDTYFLNEEVLTLSEKWEKGGPQDCLTGDWKVENGMCLSTRKRVKDKYE